MMGLPGHNPIINRGVSICITKKQKVFTFQGLIGCQLKQGNTLLHPLDRWKYKWLLIPSVGVWWVGTWRRGRRTFLSQDAEVPVRIIQSFQRPLNSTCQNLNMLALWQSITFSGVYLRDSFQVYNTRYKEVLCYMTNNCEKSKMT